MRLQDVCRDWISISRRGDTNEKANPERLAFSILVPPPRVELGTNGFRFV
jgi:hypothetical protein